MGKTFKTSCALARQPPPKLWPSLMLQNSDQFSASDDVLVCSPHTGFGYQLASALGRLGKKVTGLFPSKREFEPLKELALRCVEFSFEAPVAWEKTDLSGNLFAIKNFVLSFNEPLAKNEPPGADILAASVNLCQHLFEKYPDLHLTVVLPESTATADVQSLKNISPRSTTLLLTPALYGMRDQFILDHLFSLQGSDIARLQTPFTSSLSFPTTFVADVVAFVISTLGQDRLKGKIIQVPASINDLEELARVFSREHSVHNAPTSLLDSLKSHLVRKNPLESFLQERLGTDKLTAESTTASADGKSPTQPVFSTADEKSHKVPVAENALDLFPSNLTAPERALKMSFQSRKRFPELNSHFPPSRSL